MEGRAITGRRRNDANRAKTSASSKNFSRETGRSSGGGSGRRSRVGPSAKAITLEKIELQVSYDPVRGARGQVTASRIQLRGCLKMRGRSPRLYTRCRMCQLRGSPQKLTNPAGRLRVQLLLSAPDCQSGTSKPKSNTSVRIGIRLDAPPENSQDNAAPYRVRKTGCLPVLSDSIRHRPCSPQRQKCFSNRRPLHRREPCSLSQDPVTNP